MEFETTLVDSGVIVAQPALLHRERKNRYGSVPGLADEELATPEELERQMYKEEFKEVLMLPVPVKKFFIQPTTDEYFGVDWGAFGTVDFERYSGGFNKARYKADKLREELKDQLIVFDTIIYRLPKKAALVLKYVKMGILDIDDIENMDMWLLAQVQLRINRLRSEIERLDKGQHYRVNQEFNQLLEAGF